MNGLAREINLLKYITPVSRQNADIQAVLASETVELQGLWDALCNIFDNQFFLYMTDYGLSKWESVFDIIPKASDTLDNRRARIQMLIRGTRPYTLKHFQQILDDTYGRGEVTLVVDANQYQLRILLSDTFKQSFLELYDYTERIVPKNLLIYLEQVRISIAATYTGAVGCQFKAYEVYPPLAHDSEVKGTAYQGSATTTTSNIETFEAS